MTFKRILCVLFATSLFAGANAVAQNASDTKSTQTDEQTVGTNNPNRAAFNMVVMDPLSAPLACDCVQGYAQRKYERLGSYLSQKTKLPVRVVWAESLTKAKKDLNGKVDLVIGKHSVVQSEAKKNKLEMDVIAQLTGSDGKVTQTGLVVVRRNDPAITASDLLNYRIFFGPEDCDEKHSAPIEFIKAMGGDVPKEIETAEACSAAATQLLELENDVKAAAIISSYAQPLLEGCGTIKKGDLRVIGESKEVHFITAHISRALSDKETELLTNALMNISDNDELLLALESKSGFQPFKPLEEDDNEQSDEVDQADASAKKK